MNKLYEWDQDLYEIHISFKRDNKEIKTHVDYLIQGRYLKITYNGMKIMEGILEKSIELGSEYWIKKEDTIDFYMTKKKKEWWECILEGTEKVDIKKLAENCDVEYSLLDEDTKEMLKNMPYKSRIRVQNPYKEEESSD